MKNNISKVPSRVRSKNAGNGSKHANTSPSKPSFAGGALNLRNDNTKKTDISSIISKTGRKTSKKLPELLAPAGSFESLKAAVAGGADAVYFGGGDLNARINAKNFMNEEIADAISLLHSCGKKAYITLNTLVHEKETEDYLRFAEFVYKAGADALIVADLGGAEALRRHLPHVELHASTQMSGHNLAEAQLLADNGFSRMVCARELSKEDLEYLVKNSPIEIETFVHGALCVCHSGQCLFSSIVGGRSGNRGLCAQPCRLPYRDEAGKECYPLSLKDLSLASHVKELTACGVHSLKIEGRMKSPEYVYGVVRAFRTLLDEDRNATPNELSGLAKIFSRDGFTDGYYRQSINRSMLGIRSDAQKQASRTSLVSSERMDLVTPKKKEISALAEIKLGKASSLTLTCDDISVTAYGKEPERAVSSPLSPENIQKNLSKFGATAFVLKDYTAEVDDGIILSLSSLNSLRREAAEMLEEALKNTQAKREGFEKYIPVSPKGEKKILNSARFYSARQITHEARRFFDIIYLPLDKYNGECDGIILPPVIFDSELKKVKSMLAQAKEKGAKYALVGNLGALDAAKQYGFSLHGDFRFNVYNNESAAKLESLGIESILLSPELTLPQMRDIKGDTASIVYGRIPLMLLEKCVIKEVSSCDICDIGKAVITDRRGIDFPVLREFEHRNVVYNSAPTYMADRKSALENANITNRHFIFSNEKADEVDEIIYAYKNQSPAPKDMKIRRI